MVIAEGTLVIGAVFFGLGWGLTGICPGPGLAGIVPLLQVVRRANFFVQFSFQ